jgi:hypothetical protein
MKRRSTHHAHRLPLVYTELYVCWEEAGMGAVRGMIIILTLIAWFGSLVALVALPLLLRRSLRTDRQGVRPRVHTIDRLRAAGRLVSWGPRTIGRLPGTMRQDTTYRRRPAYPMTQQTQRVPRGPVDAPRHGRRPDARASSVDPIDRSSDPDRRFRTLQTAKVVRQRSNWPNSPAWEERDQPQPPRNRRAPFDR